MGDCTYEIQYLPAEHEHMQRVHDFLNARMEVPVMDIEYVDISCPSCSLGSITVLVVVIHPYAPQPR